MQQESPLDHLTSILQKEGYTEKMIAELWKWYDPSKKGVASF
jgi:hypothetical protein